MIQNPGGQWKRMDASVDVTRATPDIKQSICCVNAPTSGTTSHTRPTKTQLAARPPLVTRRLILELDTELTHGQRASYRARPMNIQDVREVTIGIRGLGGERLAPASYARRPNLQNGFVFRHPRGIKSFSRLSFTKQLPEVCVSDAWCEGVTYY